MSAKTDRDRLVAKTEELHRLLAEAQELAEAQLRNVERLSLKAGRTDDAEAALARTHQDRDDAWKRVRVLQQQVLDRDVELAKQGELLRTLAEQNRTLIVALEAIAVEDLEAGFAS